MKGRAALVVVFLCVFSQISAQEDFPELDTGAVYSGFAAIYSIPTHIGSQTQVYIGGIGSVLIRDRIILGAYGLRKTGELYAEKGKWTGKLMSFGSAGLVGGYTFSISKRWKPVFQCFAGWGGMTVSTTDPKGYAITEEFNRTAVIVPSIHVDYNLFWYLWLSVGADYMFVNGISLDGYTNDDFSNPGLYLSLKVMTGG